MTLMFPDLVGKVAVVTGGARGVGAETCSLLAANGATVAVSGRDRAAIAAVVGGIRAAGGRAIGVEADCASFAAIDRMRRQVERELGPTDVLVAFGGGAGDHTPATPSAEAAGHVVGADLIATFLTVKSFLPGMIERRQGLIVTMPSVNVLSRHVAEAVAEHGIRVTGEAPKTVLTSNAARRPETRRQEVATVALPAPPGKAALGHRHR